MVTRLLLVVEYEGTRYKGFQLQPDVPTIQSELEMALKKLTGEDIRVKGACRTDTGVHAKGQVVSFVTRSNLPIRSFISGLNYHIPDDIAVMKAHEVNEDFDVRRAASRRYCYYISNTKVRSPLKRRFTHLITRTLDVEAMDTACQELLGEHDFRSFATSLDGSQRNTVRCVSKVRTAKRGSMVTFDITANSFLPHQVRNTVGALTKVGLGKMRRQEFRERMAAKIPGLMGPTAPPQGLFLIQVSYDEPHREPEDDSLQ